MMAVLIQLTSGEPGTPPVPLQTAGRPLTGAQRLGLAKDKLSTARSSAWRPGKHPRCPPHIIVARRDTQGAPGVCPAGRKW